MTDFQALADTKDVARILKLSRKTTGELLRDGVIPSVIVGKRRRVVLRDLMGWIEDRKKGGLR